MTPSPFLDSHRQQTEQVGCLYFSAHAITANANLLEYTADASAARFYLRLIEQGLMAFTLYCAEPPNPYTTTAFWERLRERFTRDNAPGLPHAPLLVAISGATDGWLHQVAIAIPVLPGENTVHVSDSNFDRPLQTTWDVFLNSQYACAHRVEIIGPAELDAYPPQFHAPGGTNAKVPEETC